MQAEKEKKQQLFGLEERKAQLTSIIYLSIYTCRSPPSVRVMYQSVGKCLF